MIDIVRLEHDVKADFNEEEFDEAVQFMIDEKKKIPGYLLRVCSMNFYRDFDTKIASYTVYVWKLQIVRKCQERISADDERG